MKSIFALALAAFLIAQTAEAQATNAKPAEPIGVRIEGSAVTATGLTPGGAVAAVVSWRKRHSGSSEVSQTWSEGRADARGEAALTFTRPAPQDAFLAFIDVATGRVAISAGDGTRFSSIPLPEKRLKRNDKREVEEVSSPQNRTMIVVVRAGEGAWVQIGRDGGRGDADGRANGRVATNPSSMTPIAGSPAPPSKIRNRDVVLVVDLDRGTYASTEVSQ